VAVGLAVFPLVSRVCGRLPDKGYAISKVVGLLLVTYVSWILASARLLQFGSVSVYLSFALVLAVSLFLGRKRLKLRYLPLKPVLATEAVFLVAYALFLVFLYETPDINYVHSEDFMDFAFMQSILRTDYFPPPDPWLAGESIPYYYGGHLASAVVTKMSHVPAPIAYNLAVASFFALTVAGAFGLGYGLTKGMRYGLVAVVFVCALGFFSGALQMAAFFLGKDVAGYWSSGAPDIIEWFRSYDFVSSNWLIEGVALRNPVYTFLIGDMHATDVMDFPFQLALITLVLALVKRAGSETVLRRSEYLSGIALLALTLGFFGILNTWSYVVYLVFLLLAFVLLRTNLSKKAMVTVVGLSLALYLPYHLGRGAAGVRALGLVETRTELAEFLEVYPLFILAILTLLCVLARPALDGRTTRIVAVVLGAATISVALLIDFQLLILCVPLILISLALILRSAFPREREFVLLLVLVGALIVFGCEIVYINDELPAPFERFNTLAKFYLHTWIMFGVASAYAIFLVVKASRGARRAIWLVALGVLILGAAIRPIGLVANYVGDAHDYGGINRGTLDGVAYVQMIDERDYDAIRWMEEHIDGSHVVLEAPGPSYAFSSRISALTGLPTVIGWASPHEVMWRGGWEEVTGRDREVDAIYESPDGEEAIGLLMKYNVEYVYVGGLERERYGEEVSGGFDETAGRYRLVYENDGARLYEVLAR